MDQPEITPQEIREATQALFVRARCAYETYEAAIATAAMRAGQPPRENFTPFEKLHSDVRFAWVTVIMALNAEEIGSCVE